MHTPSLGEFVGQRRKDMGITLTELARRAELSKSELSAVERGRVALPGADKRRRLATALGVSHADLLIAAGELLEDEVPHYAAIDPDEYTVRNAMNQLTHEDRQLLVEFAVLLSRRQRERFE